MEYLAHLGNCCFSSSQMLELDKNITENFELATDEVTLNVWKYKLYFYPIESMVPQDDPQLLSGNLLKVQKWDKLFTNFVNFIIFSWHY